MENLKKALKTPGTTERLVIETKLNNLFVESARRGEDRVGMHGSGVIASDNEFCERQQVLSFFYKGNEVPHPVSLRRIFAQGNAIHEKWQKMFEHSGIAVGIEQRGFSDSWKLLFTPDAIVRFGLRTYVVEIKSVNTHQFKTMVSHPSAHKQIQLYMHMLCIPHGFVLCEDKNTQEIKVFPYEYDPEVARPFVERMHDVIKAIEKFETKKVLPSKNPLCKSDGCTRALNCQMREACFGIRRAKLE